MALEPEVEAYRKQLPRHQFYLIFTERVPDVVNAQEVHESYLNSHYAWLTSMDEQGKLFAAGPLRDATSQWDGSGMFIIRAASVEEATTIADSEPTHAAGVRRYRIIPWQLNEGGFSIRVSHATGKFLLGA